MKKTLPLMTFLALSLVTAPALAAKFYKWTDAQGVTHYSADPPADAGSKASEIRIRNPQADEPSGPADAKAAAKPGKGDARKDGRQDDKEKEGDKKPAGTPAEKYAEKCKKLQADLKTMQEYARVKETDEKGESRILSEEEKNERMDDVRRQIKAYCE